MTAEPLDGADSLPRLADRGVGYLKPRKRALGVSDTIAVSASPSSGAQVVARFIIRRLSEHTWCSWLETRRKGTRDGVIEVGYEEQALAMDTIVNSTSDGAWAHVMYGYDSEGRAQRGWTPMVESVNAIAWGDHFAELGGLLVYSRDAPAVFTKPGGERLDFTPVRDQSGHVGVEMTIHGRYNEWLDVTLATPNPCNFPTAAQRTVRGWVRVTDDRRRPAFWYYTRGC